MISVVIPALNEEKTIRQVIAQAKRNALVSEIIIVDDQSIDNTVVEAQKENVKVITSTQLGKGSSMQEGMMAAKNELVVFLDADIPNYDADIVEKLTLPLINDEADFVKSYFDRQAGRVTEILVKPLLEFFFPHLLRFKQPLSGMIAGKKSFFQKVEFENDYGVDIGLLIDMHQVNARIKEVCIGEIENDMQPLVALSRMAKQVAQAIFKRVNIFSGKNEEADKEELQRMSVQIELAMKKLGNSCKKMIVFGMDNTLLRGDFIQQAAKSFGFEKELADLRSKEKNDYLRTKKIARLLEGRAMSDMVNIVESIPLIGGAVHVIRELQLRGYMCGIVSDGYSLISHHIKTILGLDFALSHELEMVQNKASGEVRVSSYFLKNNFSRCKHDLCNANMFIYILNRFGIHSADAVAVGGDITDLCMLRLAGTGIALNANNKRVEEVANFAIKDESLKPLLEIIK
ncbi:MAG: glycosyltransferase [Bacteroidetes bacterium]|nr:glycosyltransferase [Bacteroidota bacterium]